MLRDLASRVPPHSPERALLTRAIAAVGTNVTELDARRYNDQRTHTYEMYSLLQKLQAPGSAAGASR